MLDANSVYRELQYEKAQFKIIYKNSTCFMIIKYFPSINSIFILQSNLRN